MINYYQPRILPFLQVKSQKLPSKIKSRYYFSFEDALWDLIQKKFTGKKKIKVLVPDFYCSNVLDNIRLHGHEYVYYPLDKNFQISAGSFRRYLWLFKPDVVIIFHACGITSSLIADPSWLPDLPESSLIIEDSVHRLVNPEKVSLLNDRHFIVDSLRKVSPFPGSRVFASKKALSYPSSAKLISAYSVSAFILYFVFRTFLRLGFILNSSSLVIWSHEKILKSHDEIIGDSMNPHTGFSLYLPFIRRINYKKVEDLKRKQIELYEKYLAPLYSGKKFYHLNIPDSDFGLLHVYPLGYSASPDKSLITLLHSKGIPVWFKFTDTPWSQHRAVLFLPLGFHMNEDQIRSVSETLLTEQTK